MQGLALRKLYEISQLTCTKLRFERSTEVLTIATFEQPQRSTQVFKHREFEQPQRSTQGFKHRENFTESHH
jgi:hypothetical protein